MILDTERQGVVLRRLTRADAGTYTDLMQANEAHLTSRGDFRDQVSADAGQYAEQFGAGGPALAFGIVEAGRLVGAVELVPVDPPRYGLGYWLAADATGRGLATIAVRTIVGYAGASLGASDVYAGVTHGNEASAAVLRRAGFVAVQRFDTYTRFHSATGAPASSGGGTTKPRSE
ncbi:GCN5-related protein N-acetyltransferase [Beutenbergia cavernae DSM 12333]|uniref:GCN5-related protein N-acetyltransferase n=1 Tax=Beutenbergia cavernae (strain ATCC BAA-8 / DSM 12333 / CCUG 43141 / JCM 11478 / NBRC 16432 / NCIMB 13614 / HKI 0122) TaxID=471853 RepID=C5C2Q7_BEUC1|nr:GNAT family protein [Beutenbergia cavernae]ACQ81751.1 GCN5-related protein N-acetyltransferase [Beutenbergia cavernae DSM 12333]